MGYRSLRTTHILNLSKCLAAEREARRRERQRADPAVLDFNSPSVVFTDSCARATMPSELVPVPQSTWLPSSNTSLLKSLSWQEMLPATTRRQESSPDIFNSPSVMTRS